MDGCDEGSSAAPMLEDDAPSAVGFQMAAPI
jgi:hypothetical protein